MAKDSKLQVWPANSPNWHPYGDLLMKLLVAPVSSQYVYKITVLHYGWSNHFSVQVLAWASMNNKAVYSTVYRVWHKPGADLSGLKLGKTLKHPGARRDKFYNWE